MSELNSKSVPFFHTTPGAGGNSHSPEGRGRDNTHVGATARMRTVSFSACVTVLVPFCREEGGSSWLLDTHTHTDLLSVTVDTEYHM